MTGLSPRGFLSLTAALPLRVVEGASKFIEGASLYKTFTTGLSPVGKLYNRPAGVGNAFPLARLRGKGGGAATQGGRAQRASQQKLFSCHMTLKVNPVTPLASPLGEEGHEVAKGWTVVRMIMIFLFYVLSP